MIYVDYVYLKKNNTPIKCETSFNTVNKAVRFIYKIIGKPNYVYDGFRCDDAEDTVEMNNKL